MAKQTRQFGSRWFRVYDEAADDPKLVMLSDKLHRFLFTCWCLASKHEGYLPPVAEVACRMRKSPAAVSAMLAELHERGLLDREAETFTPHNWNLRQYKSDVSTSRVKAFRERLRNADETFPKRNETVSETPSEQIQSRTETDTEQIPFVRAPLQSRRIVTDLDAATSERFEEFWRQYPRQQRRDFAGSQWVSVVNVENEGAVFACLGRYLASDEVARGVVANPDKWLYEQHRNGWAGDWQKARQTAQKASFVENVTRSIEQSLMKGESPW